ncbi:MAG: putative sensor domain DACNV-containing protein [Syntrophobacteraceae bacterium]
MLHANARDLALYVTDHWGDTRLSDLGRAIDPGPEDALPDQNTLDHLISCCYQASLMREEDRPVRFRLILREPGCFNSNDGPPTGLHRLQFGEPQPFDEGKLQRLSPATDFYRSLIGVRHGDREGLQIWGIVHSGSRWVQNVYGGRMIAPALPLSLVVYVTDPGRITVCKGPLTIATLNRGQIVPSTHEVFDSAWLSASFPSVRSRLWESHIAARDAAKKPWADLDPGIVNIIAQQVARRIISSVRNAGHGGTILVVPPEMVGQVIEENPYLNIEYRVTDEATRKRFQTLLVDLMNTLAEVYGRKANKGKPVGWEEYVASSEESLALLDEAVFDLAYLFADLTSVDGAVVFTGAFELLGFGAMISVGLKGVRTVARALDIEGLHTEQVHAGSFGARHRSAFRFCNAVHEAIAIVVSQDRLVRFVKWKEGMVTYSDHVATSIMDF